MFSKNSPIEPRLYAALFCVLGCASLVFNSISVGAQTKRFNAVEQNFGGGGAPVVAATLTDAFPDPDGDGRAAAGEEVTYTATITNSGNVDATGVSFTTQLDGNSTLVANSLRVQPDLNQYAIRCTFFRGDPNSGFCDTPNGGYSTIDANFNTIIGGHDYLTGTSSNNSYNAGTGIFQFDVTVQNLITNAFGTLDGTTPDPAGIRLFLQSARVTSGTGNISIANADGTGTFTAPNQPYFQYSEILQQNEVSAIKTIQVNVPNTVDSFTLNFLVSTKVQDRLVINEVLVNPANPILDSNGEWFELYNAGQLPVNLKGYLINDYSNTDTGNGCEIIPSGSTICASPPHTIASDLIIQPGGYAVLGNTTNTNNNGGVPVDYAYGATLSLVNSIDGVRLRTPGGLIIDKAFYASAAISAKEGVSRELKNAELNNINIDGSNWGDAAFTAVYGQGGRGTPKAQNSTFTPAADPIEDKSSIDKISAGTEIVRVVPTAGETVTANLGTITPGASATVTYRVTVANPIPMGTTQLSDQGSVTGGNFPSLMTDDPATPAANDATVTPIGLAPTASSVSISGKVITPQELGLTNALVTLTDMHGESRTVLTGKFGAFRFTDIMAGETYILTVTSKRYTYAPQVITVTEDLTELVFTAQ